MKGRITLIREVKNEFDLVIGYELAVEFDSMPSLKLGMAIIENTE